MPSPFFKISGGKTKMAKQVKQENVFEQRHPILETNISKSKDGKWVIHKTTITDIKPAAYYEKIISRGE